MRALDQVLGQTPVNSIADAVAVMTAIDQTLPDQDGVKWFNRLYLRTTVAVRDALGTTTFNDPDFLVRLDVVFANQYFAALVAGSTHPVAAPSAWKPVLEARQTPGIARLQFAVAGMNAHINRDLPDGVVQVFNTMGGDLLTADAREQDFESLNPILERVEEQVKAEFTIGLVGVIDEVGGPVDDAIAMWKVRAARAAAWTNAQVLWGLRHTPRLRHRFFDRLDGLVGLSGRGLLIPLDRRLRRP
jgi:hypothetical protein